ncbi:hypothetical protein [Sinorhizobium sp. RAC02]|uniref:hypothetical protein n=1 Tax=Sinorhizobium sp. RAC02 TaxID=1842534 RepID=UPI0008576280|nr:putative membrane protein [Sinorhizobium sp. RAC02]
MDLAAGATGASATFQSRPAPVFPSRPLHLGGSVAWGLLMAACAFVSLAMQGRAQTFHLAMILLIFFAGGVLAWIVVLPMARLLTRRRSAETRFAAHFALLSLGTVVATAFLFAMDYRLFYAQWHQPFGTRIWAYQFVFTSAGAVYQFLVMGLRLYLPVGLPILAGASLWLARSMPPYMR